MMKIALFISLTISVLAIVLNVGLALYLFGIILVPIIALHGLMILRVEKEQIWLVVISSVLFLVFSLTRSDGVHVMSQWGYNELMRFFNINSYFSFRSNEEVWDAICLVAFLLTFSIDLRVAFEP